MFSRLQGKMPKVPYFSVIFRHGIVTDLGVGKGKVAILAGLFSGCLGLAWLGCSVVLARSV